jgi:hypothetical protein
LIAKGSLYDIQAENQITYIRFKKKKKNRLRMWLCGGAPVSMHKPLGSIFNTGPPPKIRKEERKSKALNCQSQCELLIEF